MPDAERAQRVGHQHRCRGRAAARAIRDGPSASAASTSTRLVSDFDPGSSTRARTGLLARGATHDAMRTSCRTAQWVGRVQLPLIGACLGRARRSASGRGRSAASVARGSVEAMCGRYVSVKSDGDVLRDFDAVDATDDDRVRGRLEHRADQAGAHDREPAAARCGRATPAKHADPPAAGDVVGPRPVLGKGPQDPGPDVQRARRERGRQARVPHRVRQAALPDPRRRLVRVAAHRRPGRPDEAAAST